MIVAKHGGILLASLGNPSSGNPWLEINRGFNPDQSLLAQTLLDLFSVLHRAHRQIECLKNLAHRPAPRASQKIRFVISGKVVVDISAVDDDTLRRLKIIGLD